MLSKTIVSENDRDWPAIKVLLKNSGFPSLVTSVDANDEMYQFGLDQCPDPELARFGYFRCGIHLNTATRQVFDWYFGKKPSKKCILDFASGYGRGTRVMQVNFKDHELWASDILPGAVEFQKKKLKSNTFMSSTKAADFDPKKKFDFIWVVSLFSHLPDRTFKQWLGRLYELLNPGGCIAFSLHDETLMHPGMVMPASGLLFHSINEIPTLDTEEYGVSFVTEAYVAKAIEDATGQKQYKRLPRALTFHQDVYVVGKEGLPKKHLAFKHTPNGHLDEMVWVSDNKIKFRGWAADANLGEEIKSVDIYINDKKIVSTLPDQPRPDIVTYIQAQMGSQDFNDPNSGFEVDVTIKTKIAPFTDVIYAVARSTSGLEFSLRSSIVASIATFSAYSSN